MATTILFQDWLQPSFSNDFEDFVFESGVGNWRKIYLISQIFPFRFFFLGVCFQYLQVLKSAPGKD